MVKDPSRKRFVMNMQLRQCFARAKPVSDWKEGRKFSGFFISKKSL